MANKIPRVKGLNSRGIGGSKMPKKSWDSLEIDQKKQEKRIALMFIILSIVFTLLFIFLWWTKKSL